MTYTVDYERDEDGWWVASVREVPGCHTQGHSHPEARARIREALGLFVDDAATATLRTGKRPTTARALITKARSVVVRVGTKVKSGVESFLFDTGAPTPRRTQPTAVRAKAGGKKLKSRKSSKVPRAALKSKGVKRGRSSTSGPSKRRR